MRKIFKNCKINYIIIGLLGIIIGSSICITANTYLLQSKEIQYTSDKSVQQAIEELYTLANNSVGSNETLPIGTIIVEGYRITIPYTGNYPVIRCIYGTDENYGNVGTLSNNACTFKGSSANQTLYYKLVATDDTGKIYEKQSKVVTGSVSPISIVSLGDYIYMKPESTSYSITSDMTGCTSLRYCGVTQTINPSELTVWRVIRKNADGTVDVVSDKVSSTIVYFYGKIGYTKLVSSLNTIAGQYINSNFVQSARYLNKTADTSLVKAVYDNLIAYNPSGIATKYWLADNTSERSSLTTGYIRRYYGLYVNASGNIDKYELLYEHYYEADDTSDYDNYSCGNSIRPILTLKSTVKITGGSGTLGNEYRLDI